MLKKIALFIFLLLPIGAIAQEASKIAYFNTADVITAMPEYTQMQDSVQKMQAAIESELKTMEEEYDKKYSAFMAESETLVEAIRVRRLQEIQDIGQRAQTFNQQSQQQLQQIQQALFVPIHEKVKKAIEAVGEKNSFAYILDASVLLYINPSSVDATALVKKELGLK